MVKMQRNLKLLTAYTFFMNAVFILPVIVPYFRDELGLTFHQFLIGEAIFAATVLLCEVPSGWFADIWGRRITIIFAGVFSLLGYGLLALATDFWSAVASQILIGVAVSLHSGTLSAFLYDTLLSQGREDEYRKREGFRHGLGLYAVAFGAALGGLLYQWNHHAPILLELVFVGCAFGISFFMQEPPRHQKEIQHNPLHDMVETMRYALHGHKDIGALIIFVALIFGSTKVFLWAQQPYYGDLHVPESIYGFLMAAAMLAGGLGGHLGHHILRNWQGMAVMKVLFWVIIMICVLSGFALTHAGLAAIMLGTLIWGFGWPRVQETINRAVGSERRATILSTCSLMYSLAFIPMSMLLGWIEEEHDITYAMLAHGLVVFTLGGAMIVWLRTKVRTSALS
jgi:MFS family permease